MDTQTEYKTIEQNFEQILVNGKDFMEFCQKFNETLSNIELKNDTLKLKIIKLFNFLCKTSSKQKLFEMTHSRYPDGSFKEKYEIGTNSSGLGIKSNHSKILRNITEYWTKSLFHDLLKDEEFRTKLLIEINPDIAKKLEPILLKLIPKDIEKDILIENIVIKIYGKTISFESQSDIVSYHKDLNVFEITPDSQDSVKKLTAEHTLFKISNKLYEDIKLQDIQEFCYLLSIKDQLIAILEPELKNTMDYNTNLQTALDQIQEIINPYEALAKI